MAELATRATVPAGRVAFPALVLVLLLSLPASADFDLSRTSVPAGSIVPGGPPKDGIPALLSPRFVRADEADFLGAEDSVVGFARGGSARAYPLRILNWHEVVNDEVGELPVAVTYCPLTDSVLVLDRRVGEKVLTFGVSGKLYRSNVVLYDHQSESLWSQLGEEAIAGERTGARLTALPAELTTWSAWRRRHPDTLVLSPRTGYDRDYRRDPYLSYHRSSALPAGTAVVDERLRPKDRVLGVVVGSQAKAYELAALVREREVSDRIGETRVRVVYDPSGGGFRVTAGSGRSPLVAVVAYWFAWSGFHPRTALWRGPAGRAPGTRPGPPGEAAGAAGVEIEAHGAYWTRFPLGLPGEEEGGAELFVIRGEVRNASPTRELRFVELRYELLDERGRVVKSEQGYNRAAESLRTIDVGEGAPAELLSRIPDVPLRPIAAQGRDGFRMFFVATETPPFASYRIAVTRAGWGEDAGARAAERR